MSLKEWKTHLMDRMKQPGGMFGGNDPTEGNMANGGFSGYRPQSKPREATQPIPVQQPVNPAPYGDGGMPGYEQPMQPQQPMQGGTGFTGMYPPVQPGMTGQMPPANAYQQPQSWNTTSWQQPVQSTGMWQQPAPQQDAGQRFGGTGRFFQQNEQGYGSTSRYQPQSAPMQNGMAGTGRYQPQSGAQSAQQDNIRYMPNTFVGEDGKAYSHVERVAQLVSVAACYRIIEFMRNGESVIVNTEAIANDAEIQRCMDMLSGAAYTLNCSITKITQIKRAYLIAPITVLVLPDGFIQRMSDRDGGRWQGGAEEELRGYRGGREERQEQEAYAPYPREDAGRQAAGYDEDRSYGRDQRTDASFTHRHGFSGKNGSRGYGSYGGFGGASTAGFGQ